MIKSGWQSTEFWTTLAGQLLALLTILGLIQRHEAATLEEVIGQCITAVFILVTNAWVVVRYVQSRTQLKQTATQSSTGLPILAAPWLALALGGWLAVPAQAAEPGLKSQQVPTCWLRFELRQRLREESALRGMMQQMIGLQQQSLANQQAILAQLQRPAPPAPAVPILVQPHGLQELPIASRPRQELPVEGKPRQELPDAGKPRQDLPDAGKPQQELPGAAKPRQELPARPNVPAGQPLPMQRYTLVRAVAR